MFKNMFNQWKESKDGCVKVMIQWREPAELEVAKHWPNHSITHSKRLNLANRSGLTKASMLAGSAKVHPPCSSLNTEQKHQTGK